MTDERQATAEIGSNTLLGFVSGAPTATAAGADTAFRFTNLATAVMIQNNTAANVNVAFDATANAGSFVLAANSGIVILYVPCSVLHLYTAAAQNVNGSAAAGIVVAGLR